MECTRYRDRASERYVLSGMVDESLGSTRPTSGPGRVIQRFRVTVTSGPAKGRTWNALAERCAIGSHPSNDLVIDDDTVSRFHCELMIAGASVRVRDLGSRNGTIVGDVALVEAMLVGG